MAKPQRQTGAPTGDVLAVIRLTAVQPRLRGRGFETAEPTADRARFDVAPVAVPLTTVVRSKTDVEATGAVVTITPAAMQALDAIRPAGVGGEVQVFGLSESQIARRVKVIAKAAGLIDWEFFSGHSGGVGMARRMAQNGVRPPTRSNARAVGNRAAAWSVATPEARPPGQRCGYRPDQQMLSNNGKH